MTELEVLEGLLDDYEIAIERESRGGKEWFWVDEIEARIEALSPSAGEAPHVDAVSLQPDAENKELIDRPDPLPPESDDRTKACPLCSIDDGLVQEWVSKARTVAWMKGLLAPGVPVGSEQEITK